MAIRRGEKLTFKPTKGPAHKRIMLKYLAPTFKVEIIRAAPIRDTTIGPIIWYPCSRFRPEDQDTAKVMIKDITYGGA